MKKKIHDDALLGVEKTSAQHEFFFTPCDASKRDIFHIKNKNLIFYLSYTLLTILFLVFRLKVEMKKKVVLN